MGKPIKRLYEFDSFRLDATDRLLMKDGEPIGLSPKVFDLLLLLVQNNGSVLDKDELMKNLWPDIFVEENNLTVNMSALRKALGESGSERQYIQTIPKRGYRFSANVRELWNGEGEKPAESSEQTAVVIQEEQAAGKGDGEATVAASNVEESTLKVDRRRRRAAAVTAMVLIAAAVFAFGLQKWIGWNQSSLLSSSFQEMKIAKLTSSGKAGAAAISPDGKYVAYAEGGALWLRQTAASSSTQIIPPSEAGYYKGVTFSLDGNYIYYVRRELVGKNQGGIDVLYQIPVLGGASKKLLEGVTSPITLSPDGKQLAFVRRIVGTAESALIIANSDGTGERILASCKLPERFLPDPPAWSPDGSIIACNVNKFPDANSGDEGYVVCIRAEDGVQSRIGSKRWIEVGGVAWLGDGSGLVICADDGQAFWSGDQIWRISYPSGEARKITNDLNFYDSMNSMSLTADSRALVTVKSEEYYELWVAPEGDTNRTRPLLTQINNFAWTPDSKIVYVSPAYSSATNGNLSLWIMNADGSNKKQLTVDGNSNYLPAVSPDGRYIVFISDRSGSPSIWRMDIDGGNPKKLADRSAIKQLLCSPDGRWAVYDSVNNHGGRVLWKSPINGGEPVQVSDRNIYSFTISPDGMLIAYFYMDDEGAVQKFKAAVVPFEGREPVTIFDLPATAEWWSIGFKPDGKALTYSSKGNLWSQPLNGDSPQQLTYFKTGMVWYKWSRDGKQLAYMVLNEAKDVVLITDFK